MLTMPTLRDYMQCPSDIIHAILILSDIRHQIDKFN